MLSIIGGIFVLIILVVLFWKWNTKAEYIEVNTDLASEIPANGFSHHTFEQLLSQFVNESGQVDYGKWHDDKVALNKLDKYLATIAILSPENSPQRFENKNQILVYWVNAYNAQVIKSILFHWPIKSVTDIKAPVELIKGLGFFYNQSFIFGGKNYSLYFVENNIILKGEIDPRVHFILNCGSEGCPVIRPQIPVNQDLEAFLSLAASEFISDPKNLFIDRKNKVIYLSMIFNWYKDDFLKGLQEKHFRPNLINYLRSICNPKICEDLKGVDNFSLSFIPYDWALNSASK